MTTEPSVQLSGPLRAATASVDLANPALSLNGLLALTSDLLKAPKSALYEFNELEGGFSPRFAVGVSVGNLGRVAAAMDNPVMRTVLSNRKAAAGNDSRGSLGLPLAPGSVACAPCITGGQTIGLLFAGDERERTFNETDLLTLEVIASRMGDVLAFARQTAGQTYLLHKLTLLYQASHTIPGTRDRQEAVRQTAAHLLKATSADFVEIKVFDDAAGKTVRFRPQLGRAAKQPVVVDSTNPMLDYAVHKQVLQGLRPATLGLQPPTGSAGDLALLEQESLAGAAVFPLATGSRALGLVRILYSQRGRNITEQETELAQAIINIGAAGLQDAIHVETAEARASQLQVLGEIGREMTSTLDLEAALENSMHHAQRLLGAEATVLFLLDDPGEKLVLKASGGSHLRIRDVAIRLEEGIAGWVTRNRRPLIVNDVRSNPLYHSAIDGQTGLLTNSVLCVPLDSRGEILGVIEALNHPRGAFTEADQQMLSSVASWAAIALDNANLFRRVTEERSRLEATLVETADAVVLTDRSGRIILVNKAASQAFRINSDLAAGRPASEIFTGHPLGEILTSDEVSFPTSLEVGTPTDRVLYATISDVPDVGRVAVMQDITALKQIDHMRSQLLGTAAHDLKNPLNAIRLGADLLLDADLSDQQRKALNMMQRATDSMTNLITGLLETIRVESTANVAFEPCQVNDLVRHAMEDLRPLAEDRSQTLEYTPAKDSLLIMGDPNRLSSVMTNLLSNAIKFSERNGLIRVKVESDDDRVLFSVADDGPGIPEDEIPRIFEHLFRGRVTVRDPNNPIEGTGLGLALAKTVIEQHGGKIWVKSQEGQGSTFFVSLPREPTPKTGSLRQPE
jgi:signal transduction histidine kinase